tara:strand:+ start:606 stop:878 length:273 start_codon:yes stop_codon:yes gene_type:complete
MTVIVQKSDRKVVVDKKQSQVTINKNTLGSSFTSFTAAADSGNSQITEGETLTLTGGTGITTAVSGDTVTFNVESGVVMEGEIIDGGDGF